MLLNDVLSNALENIKLEGWREFVGYATLQCIVQGDSIQSYKNYYNEAKAYFVNGLKENKQNSLWGV